MYVLGIGSFVWMINCSFLLKILRLWVTAVTALILIGVSHHSSCMSGEFCGRTLVAGLPKGIAFRWHYDSCMCKVRLVRLLQPTRNYTYSVSSFGSVKKKIPCAVRYVTLLTYRHNTYNHLLCICCNFIGVCLRACRDRNPVLTDANCISSWR